MNDSIGQHNPFEPPQTDQFATETPAVAESAAPPEIGEPLTAYFRSVYGWMLFGAVAAALYGAVNIYNAWSYHSYGQELEAMGETLLPSYTMNTRADFIYAVTSFAIAALLLRAALGVRVAAKAGSLIAFNDALDRQRHYWVYAGVLTAAELLIFFGVRLFDYLEQRSAAL